MSRFNILSQWRILQDYLVIQQIRKINWLIQQDNLALNLLICDKKNVGVRQKHFGRNGLSRNRLTRPKWQKLLPGHLPFSSAELLDQQGLCVGFH